MEFNQQGLLEDIPARSLARHIFNNNTLVDNEFFFQDNGCKRNCSSCNIQPSNQNPSCSSSDYSFLPFSASQSTSHQQSSRESYYLPSLDYAHEIATESTVQPSSYDNKETISPVYEVQDHAFASIWLEEENFFPAPYHFSLEAAGNVSSSAGKVEMEFPAAAFNMGLCDQINKKKNQPPKTLQGQPFSKNLMAERRRRKRLNDRLSMLRSIVPRVSKMDRTSILADTIEYMRELIEKINKHEEEMNLTATNIQLHQTCIVQHQMPTETQIRSLPKFNAESRHRDIHVDICCAYKPGFLLSTLSTLDSLGLEIQECVISTFNDFSMQATSLQQGGRQQMEVSSDDIKQALLKNAGYSGTCL